MVSCAKKKGWADLNDLSYDVFSRNELPLRVARSAPALKLVALIFKIVINSFNVLL